MSGPHVITGSSDTVEPASERRAGFEGGRRGHVPGNVGGLQEPEMAGKQILPQSLRRECSPAHTAILA